MTPRATRLESWLILGTPVAIAALLLALIGQESSLHMTTFRILRTVAFEIAFGTVVALYLWRRGWRWGDVTRPFAAKDVVRGVGVWLLAYLTMLVVWLVVAGISNELARQLVANDIVGRPAPAAVILLSIVNPVFEEALWLGWAVHGPGSNRPLAAALWSVVPRCLIHLYQGWRALFIIAPLGACYFAYYFRTKRIWPPIIAHGIQDLISIGALALRGTA